MPSVSPGDLPQGIDLELFVGDDALQALVLLLQLLQALGIVGLRPPELGTPAVIGGLGDLELAADLGHVGAFTGQAIGLSESADDLLGRVPASSDRLQGVRANSSGRRSEITSLRESARLAARRLLRRQQRAVA
jgi:hypothetical protein